MWEGTQQTCGLTRSAANWSQLRAIRFLVSSAKPFKHNKIRRHTGQVLYSVANQRIKRCLQQLCDVILSLKINIGINTIISKIRNSRRVKNLSFKPSADVVMKLKRVLVLI